MTLQFRDAALEKRYRGDASETARTRARISIVVGFVAWLVMVFLGTPALLPEHQDIFASATLWVELPVCALGFAMTWLPGYGHLCELLRAAVLTVMGLTLVAVQALRPTIPLWMGWGFVMMVVLYVYVVTGMRFPTTLATALTVSGAYVVVIARFVPPGVLVGYACWVAGFNTVGMMSSYQSDRSRRRDWFQKSEIERLLLNVLPEQIARRLQREGGLIADGIDEVTVLFADIVGFTPLSERLSPAQVVSLLDRVFTAFDELAERGGVEKIKTIGDAYMAVAGAPSPRADHAVAAVELAQQMRTALARIAPELQLRIGLHSGSVVAGVIGKRRYSYDLWGDTVNTASRMESHGVPGTIQLSDATRGRLGADFPVEDRGVIEVKGKGPMRTWLIR